jgi:hypothetical protein
MEKYKEDPKMAILEIDKDMMLEIFSIKENVKKSVYAVMENRLTAAHLASDVFVLLERLDEIEIQVIGEPIVQEVPPIEQTQVTPPETPVEEQEPAPAEQPQPEQNQGQ